MQQSRVSHRNTCDCPRSNLAPEGPTVLGARIAGHQLDSAHFAREPAKAEVNDAYKQIRKISAPTVTVVAAVLIVRGLIYLMGTALYAIHAQANPRFRLQDFPARWASGPRVREESALSVGCGGPSVASSCGA